MRPMNRPDGRARDQIRPISFQLDFAPHATGSVLVSSGNTRVICSAMVEEGVPRWMKEQKVSGGWITAEYSMLPYSTLQRKARDISRGKLDGRGVEIQRLIGRSLRATIDLEALGPRTMWLDCDVLQADGGTRTAAITGACVAVALAGRRLVEQKLVEKNPLLQWVAAVSVGIVGGEPVLDLNYLEDRDASVDMNVVMTAGGQFIELQGSGEESTFSPEQLEAMLALARKGVGDLLAHQQQALQVVSAAAPARASKSPFN